VVGPFKDPAEEEQYAEEKSRSSVSASAPMEEGSTTTMRSEPTERTGQDASFTEHEKEALLLMETLATFNQNMSLLAQNAKEIYSVVGTLKEEGTLLRKTAQSLRGDVEAMKAVKSVNRRT